MNKLIIIRLNIVCIMQNKLQIINTFMILLQFIIPK